VLCCPCGHYKKPFDCAQGKLDMNIDKAVEILRSGGVIIFPTDTVWGMGVAADNPAAIKKFYKIKKREKNKPTAVLVADLAQAETLGQFSDQARDLAKKYWPGALTIVALCKTQLIHSPIRGNGASVGLRMPNHPTLIRVISAIEVPLLGPSANFHGDATPYRFEDLNPALTALVDYVIPGICSVQSASTVVDCSTDPYRIIRQGAVSLHKI